MAISAEKRMEAVVSCVMNDSAAPFAAMQSFRRKDIVTVSAGRGIAKKGAAKFVRSLVLPLLSHSTLRCFRRESFATTSLARENLQVRRRRRR